MSAKTVVLAAAKGALQGILFAALLTAVMAVFGGGLLAHFMALAILLMIIYAIEEDLV